MTGSPATPYTLVADYAQFLNLCSVLDRADRVAIDTESDSMHHYPERVCLVQVATPGSTHLLDPLALGDLSPLRAVLAAPGVRKLLHGADYDLRSLNRDWGLTFTNLFDTHVAARFMGMERVGLAALLQELLGVEIPKDRKIQRADWSRRPLHPAALRYAVADVCHLFDLHDVMAERLRKLGRLSWVQEECRRLCEVRFTPPDLEATVLALPQSRKMDGRQLAVLLALYRFRDEEARRLDRPPSHVLSPATLASVAADPSTPLESHAALTARQVERFGKGLRAAVRQGLAGAPVERPAPPPSPLRGRPTPGQTRKLAALKAWRQAQAKDLGIEVGLVWPMRSLERLARDPGSFREELLNSPEVRDWQRDRFGASLRQAVGA